MRIKCFDARDRGQFEFSATADASDEVLALAQRIFFGNLTKLGRGTVLRHASATNCIDQRWSGALRIVPRRKRLDQIYV